MSGALYLGGVMTVNRFTVGFASIHISSNLLAKTLLTKWR